MQSQSSLNCRSLLFFSPYIFDIQESCFRRDFKLLVSQSLPTLDCILVFFSMKEGCSRREVYRNRHLMLEDDNEDEAEEVGDEGSLESDGCGLGHVDLSVGFDRPSRKG